MTLRPDGLVRAFFLICVVFSVWLAVPAARDFAAARDHAAQTRQELRKLDAEHRRLAQQSQELVRGSGLEEQARRQGLIDPSERSYVIEDLPQR